MDDFKCIYCKFKINENNNWNYALKCLKCNSKFSFDVSKQLYNIEQYCILNNKKYMWSFRLKFLIQKKIMF